MALGHEKSDVGEGREHKIELDPMATMLSRLCGRGYCMGKGSEPYECAELDPGPDSDFDNDEIKPQISSGDWLIAAPDFCGLGVLLIRRSYDIVRHQAGPNPH